MIGNTTILCSDSFYLDEITDLCYAECGKWQNLPHNVEVATDIILILGSVVYIVSASVVLVVAYLQSERM